MKPSESHNLKRPGSWVRSALLFSLAAGLLAPAAHAGFINGYAPDQFTLTNTNADGCLGDALQLQCLSTIPTSALSVTIIGGHNGSGDPGTTDWLITALATGTVSFQYSYSSLDGPGWDDAEFLLNGASTVLATFDGQNGSAMFSVTAGSVFGFRLGTTDNQGEPGILTISSFSAPEAAPAPEPATASLMGAAAGCAAILGVWRRRRGARA